jgi:hypothetical protein
MKRRLSNPFKVILSGVLDFVMYMVILFVLFGFFDKSDWRVHLAGRIYATVNLLATGVTIALVVLILPLLDYNGGTFGKRIVGLKCIQYKNSAPASFGNYLLKYMSFGLLVLLKFFFSFRILDIKESDVFLTMGICDKLIILIFLLQLVSLFIGKRSLFEILSQSLVVPTSYIPETGLFSFENRDGFSKDSSEFFNQ